MPPIQNIMPHSERYIDHSMVNFDNPQNLDGTPMYIEGLPVVNEPQVIDGSVYNPYTDTYDIPETSWTNDPNLFDGQGSVFEELIESGPITIDSLESSGVLTKDESGNYDFDQANDLILGAENALNNSDLSDGDRAELKNIRSGLMNAVDSVGPKPAYDDGLGGLGGVMGGLTAPSDGYRSETATQDMLDAQQSNPEILYGSAGMAIPGGKLQRGELRSGYEGSGLMPGLRQGDVGFGAPQSTFNTRFDGFTDTLADGAKFLLKPVDMLADGLGYVSNEIGGAIGDNPIGRGFSDFGSWLDKTGDFVSEGIPDRVINYPDNFVNAMTGVGRGLSGTAAPMGQPGNWQLAKSGGIGMLTDPIKLGTEAAMLGKDLLMDVLGIDDLSLKLGGAGGGKAQKGTQKEKPKYTRKNNPNDLLANTGGRSSGSGSKGSNLSIGGEDYDLSTADGQRAYANEFGGLDSKLKELKANGVDVRNLIGSGGMGSGSDSAFGDPTTKSSVKQASLDRSVPQGSDDFEGYLRSRFPLVDSADNDDEEIFEA